MTLPFVWAHFLLVGELVGIGFSDREKAFRQGLIIALLFGRLFGCRGNLRRIAYGRTVLGRHGGCSSVVGQAEDEF